MPSPLEGGRHADVGDHHLGVGLGGAVDELVVVGGDAHDLDVGLEAEQGTHALAHDQVVVGQEHGDAPVGHGSIWPKPARPDWRGGSHAGRGWCQPHPRRLAAPLGGGPPWAVAVEGAER